MKAIFVSVATLALTVFAAPSAVEGSVAARDAPAAQPEFAVARRDQSAEDLINSITKATDNIKNIGVSVNSTLDQVNSGAITKDEGTTKTTSDLQNLLDEISGIVSEALAAAHLGVPKTELQGLLNAIHALVHNVLNIVGTILDILPLSGAISSLINQIVTLITNLLTGIASVVGSPIIPGLIDIVRAVIGGATGVLGGLLRPAFGVVDSTLSSLLGNRN